LWAAQVVVPHPLFAGSGLVLIVAVAPKSMLSPFLGGNKNTHKTLI
jgi:hypothetical protein